jgi:DNA invertase Pin-like site-specific DNA recombinase
MMLRCAAYARYSSDRQSPASIQDQLRKCREYAQQQGWQLLDEHVYADEALSGAGADRPEFARMLEATARVPRPFDVLLVDDTSRLCRNLGEAARVFERLNFLGVRIVAVSQGIDSENEQADVLMTVHGLVDSLYIKELARKTHRGLEGRALLGFHTGGRCFGYDNVPEQGGVRLRINPAEAGVVRRIFEMAADGGSLKGIARGLNLEGVPCPRPRAGKQYATWCPTAIREMLRRDLYAGRIVWNHSRFVKQPGTNKRVRRERPRVEWHTLERPDLRIIDEALWRRVQNRLAFVAQRFSRGPRAGLYHRAASSPHLLTGYLKCGLCGANLVIVTGRGKRGHQTYGCPQNFYRGACSNKLKERADWLEDRLLSQLQNAVLRPEVVEYALQEFERQLTVTLADLSGQVHRMRQRREQIQSELGRLVETAAVCGHSAALVEAINSREQELNEIAQRLLAAEPGSVSAHISNIRRFVSERLLNIRQLMNGDVRGAKALFAKHVSTVQMFPQAEGKKGHYVASGEWNLMGGYAEGIENQDSTEMRVRMVAGAYFGAIHNALGQWLVRRWVLPKNGRRPRLT